ncbi:MAG: SLBB domain-containing protein [Spirochaetales bacterium]|nr:SLBB domain-containing protein [Spirochaetales bacterium]
MLKRRVILVSAILIALALPFAFADGLFLQSPQYSQTGGYSYSSQLGLPVLDAATINTNVPLDAVLRAIGDSEYPVTPGDTFALAYSDGKNLITLELQADNDCKVTIPSIEVIDAAGMTFKEFKDKVEETISKYYTYSSPQLMLKGCGVFSLKITGEVGFSQYVTAWGLSRLSDLAYYAGEYASTRKVEITYRDGSTKTCDLFNALRNGSDEDNPLLAPGCEVRFLKADTIVSLDGAVEKAGVYQILKGESLYDLIQIYGGGLLSSADSQSIMVSNYVEGSYVARYLSLGEARSYTPANGDVVKVVYSAQKDQHVSITGAVASTGNTDSLSMANSIDYSFTEGETAEHLLSDISSLILSTGDISSAYVLRDGKKLALSTALRAGDNIIIPFSRQAVTVTGYVNNPGTFAYVPDMTADYYIALAGGFSASASGRVKVSTASGAKADADNVPSGATVYAKNNNFTTGLTITATVVSLVSSVLLMITYGHTVLGYF